MKNFSTVSARFVISALFAAGLASGAQAATSCSFRADAPDQHRVVKGDTLWDISGKFLEHPWCWGQVWNLNRAQIANPHWIYPGQIVYFNRRTGRLGLYPDDGTDGNGITRLSPQVRTLDMDRDAVPSIASSAIEPFLTQPLVIDADRMAAAPRIIAAQENHVFLGPKEKAYVRGNLDGVKMFQVFRPGKALTDPVTKKVLGYEAFYLGTAQLTAEAKPGSDVHTFTVVSVKEEMGVGDQLVPLPPTPIINYAPHPPLQETDARVMSIYGGVSYAGQSQIVSVNRGSLDGLDIGAVLQLYHFGATVKDPTAKKGWFGRTPSVKLPDEQYGDLFIFRVFDHISYGLIMQVTQPVEVGDVAKSPE
jgi:hypothetical protein